jgi:hypothetical protein
LRKSSVFLTFATSTVGAHHHQELILPRFLIGIKVPYREVRPVSLSFLPQRFESFGALVRHWIPKRATPLSKAPEFQLTIKTEDAWEPRLTWKVVPPPSYAQRRSISGDISTLANPRVTIQICVVVLCY